MMRSVALRLTMAGALLLLCAAVTGCQSSKPATTGLAPDAVANPETARGTIPTLQLVDPSTLPAASARTIQYWADGGSSPDSRPTLAAGSYKPIISGPSVTTAELTTAELDGINKPILKVTLDPAAAQVFGQYTDSHVGKQLVLVLGGSVFAAPTIDLPVTDGTYQLPLSADQVTAVKAAIVPGL